VRTGAGAAAPVEDRGRRTSRGRRRSYEPTAVRTEHDLGWPGSTLRWTGTTCRAASLDCPDGARREMPVGRGWIRLKADTHGGPGRAGPRAKMYRWRAEVPLLHSHRFTSPYKGDESVAVNTRPGYMASTPMVSIPITSVTFPHPCSYPSPLSNTDGVVDQCCRSGPWVPRPARRTGTWCLSPLSADHDQPVDSTRMSSNTLSNLPWSQQLNPVSLFLPD
jgi:hypothetical protein